MDEQIFTDIRESYNIKLQNRALIDGGWQNRLWKASDGQRDYLVKRFSEKRFSRQKLLNIEAALQRQIRLEPCGVPIPHIYLCGQKAIRFLDGTAYMLMDFSPGRNETAQSITPAQMKSLGDVCARIHKAFSQLPVSTEDTPPDILALLEKHIEEQRRNLSPDAPEGFQRMFLAGKNIFKRLPDGLFNRIPVGFSHEDFTPDNVLFDGNGVTAVIDFDRNCCCYPWHDIGRAVLSFALDLERLDITKIQAFIDGYSEHIPLTWGNVADSLRAAWCIEFPWWAAPYFFTDKFKGKAVRYRQEIQWLTENWEELNRLQEGNSAYGQTENDFI